MWASVHNNISILAYDFWKRATVKLDAEGRRGWVNKHKLYYLHSKDENKCLF